MPGRWDHFVPGLQVGRDPGAVSNRNVGVKRLLVYIISKTFIVCLRQWDKNYRHVTVYCLENEEQAKSYF